jgi:hypothetical protein
MKWVSDAGGYGAEAFAEEALFSARSDLAWM